MNELLKDIVIDDRQGFAFYFEHGNDIYTRCQGYRQAGKAGKIDLHTNFRLASVTKQFTAYGILLLIRERKLNYDSKLSDIYDYLPDNMKTMTIRQLLSHTSGICDFEDMEHGESQVRDPDVFRYIKTINKSYFDSGTQYRYSNTGFIVLGQVIEKVSGQSISGFIKEKIFSPAGMENSYINIDGMNSIKNRAYGTAIEGGGLIDGSRLNESGRQIDGSKLNEGGKQIDGSKLNEGGRLIEKDQSWMSGTTADGGIYSSVTDMKKWIDFVSNQAWLDRTMFRQNSICGISTDYGYGMKVIKYKNYKIIYHQGDTIGSNSLIGFVPKRKIKFIFFTNLDLVNTEIFIGNLIGSL